MKKPINFPIISVVVPMYNVEKYISTCIESVLKQSFQAFEIICVDDGCTDNTLGELEQFDDPRIRLVRQENMGLAAARNTGINASRGLYVALLDSDDFWASDKLIKHYYHLSRNPNIGLSYSSSLFVNEAGEEMGIGQFPQLKNINAEMLFCRNPIGNGSAPVLRASLLREMGTIKIINGQRRRCYFDENLRQSEDVEFWLRIALNSQCEIAGIKDALTYYRVNDSGLSANTEKQLAAWHQAIDNNRHGHEGFFDRHYPLALAYQLRYLARRAIRSGEGVKAVKLVHQALITNGNILIKEPSRTALTYGCAFLSLLPKHAYASLEHLVLQKNKTLGLSA